MSEDYEEYAAQQFFFSIPGRNGVKLWRKKNEIFPTTQR